MKPTEFRDLALKAYVFGYPLVTMEMTRRVMTNVVRPSGMRAPMGQFAHVRNFPSPGDKDLTIPNADTLYSSAWIDLAAEPYVLEVPRSEGRFFMVSILDAWTDVFESIGTRTSGSRERLYVLVGPDWKGTLPTDVQLIKAPTNLVWILGRTYCDGTSTDYEKAHAFQDRLSLIPLSARGSQFSPPLGRVDPSIDMNTSVKDQVHHLGALHYFRILSDSMRTNPPATADRPFVEKLRLKGFMLDQFGPGEREWLKNIPAEGLKTIQNKILRFGASENGWMDTNRLGRAAVAEIGLRAHVPEDAVYPVSTADAEGNPYSGANRYVMHFEKNRLPPVRGFWSLTMYGPNFLFVPNPIGRYSLGSRSNLRFNGDGSLDLYIQKDPPSPGYEANWLPAPPGKFNLVLRCYWPEQTVLDQTWKAPPVRRQKFSEAKKAA